MRKLLFTLCSLMILATGCSTLPLSAPSPLLGTWHGTEAGVSGESSLSVTTTTIDFRGANPAEWMTGVYHLLEDAEPKQMIIEITDCPTHDCGGHVANVIYELKNGTLTVAGHRPGNPEMPASFAEPDLRTIVFKK